MSELSPIQRQVARTLFDLPASNGYALAGGAALILRRVIARQTRDLDAFIGARPGPHPGTIDDLADEFVGAAQRRGWAIHVVRRHPTFCRLIVGCDGAAVEIDLAVDSRRSLSTDEIAQAFGRIERLVDQRFSAVTDDPAATRRYFAMWADEVTQN